jgi:protein involved in polysaccharide export with SLBB domain
MNTILRLLFVSFALGAGSGRAQAPAGSAGSAAPQALSGGFQVGDRVQLQVEGDSQFTSTFTVGPGPALALPVIGDISLRGVRRADVRTYLTQQLERYLKDPVVHAKALIRLSILGEVEHPGFHAVPVDLLVGDALMQAGGPTRDAKVAAMRIERDGKSTLEGDSLRLALARGLTVDQLGLRDGDRVVVPRGGMHGSDALWRILLASAIPAAIYGVITRVH